MLAEVLRQIVGAGVVGVTVVYLAWVVVQRWGQH